MHENNLQGSFQQKREIWLHTLAHRSVQISIRDFICSCGNLIPYDLLFENIFSIYQHHCFTRELLYSCTFDGCCLGLLFRESFSSWKRKMRSIFSSLNWIQYEPVVKIRIANDTFSAFLKLLRFSSLSTVRKIFSCNICMEAQPDGRTRWKSIVMDGTAT